MLGFLVFLGYLLFWVPTAIKIWKTAAKKENNNSFSSWWSFLRWGVGGTAVLFVLDYFSGFYVSGYLWFKELGYLPVLWTSYGIYFSVLIISFLLSVISLYLGLWLSKKWAPVIPEITKKENDSRHRYYEEPRFSRDDLIVRERGFYRLANWLFIPFLSLILAFGAADSGWQKFLMYWHQQPTGTVDPVFGKDLAFWLFTLPFANFILGIGILLGMLFLVAMVCYFWFFLVNTAWAGISENEMKNYRWRIGWATAFWISISWSVYAELARYHLLFSSSGAAYGAGYTDVSARLWLYTADAVIWLAVALFAVAATIWSLKNWKVIGAAGALVGFWFIFSFVWPAAIQSLSVRPDELRKESQYIERTIAFTRAAYGLDQIKDEDFNAEELTKKYGSQYEGTVSNIRLWDWRVIKSTYDQQQALRRYYGFRDVDVDRYTIGGKYRQVMIAARELLPDQVPEKTWVNERLKYTHGYGAIAHFGNTKTANGFPDFLVGDMPPYGPEGLLIKRPQIYFGEATTEPAVVKTEEKEFDYPAGSKNVETVYSGKGGVDIGSGLRRLAIAWNFDGWALLTSSLVNAESRILFKREIAGRIAEIAPFLTLDQDPYLVIREDGSLVWIMDAYTVSGYFPYSEPYAWKGLTVNYVRNSVKIVVDAYDGTVVFYAVDQKDPVLKAWQSVFPSLFRNLSEMPGDLRKHIRYGEDLFKLQSRLLLDYHMIDPTVFYNKEDRWSVAEEQFEDNRQQVEPYYIVSRLPESAREEMMLVLPFTPYSTKDARKENLIGWLAAHIDGENYGKLLLYRFPKGELRYGPMQVESQIDQDQTMSAQITLWNQSGSKVVRGHTLVIPVGNALMYAEPLYIKSTTSPMPQLQKVILATQVKVDGGRDMKLRLVWGDTFEEALEKLLSGTASLRDDKFSVKKPVTDSAGIIVLAREHLKRYKEFTSKGEFDKAGEELRALGELFK